MGGHGCALSADSGSAATASGALGAFSACPGNSDVGMDYDDDNYADDDYKDSASDGNNNDDNDD
jgi:hypothetical protein